VWEATVQNGDRREQAEAKGFLRTWEEGSIQLWLWNYGRHDEHLSNAAKTTHNGNLIMPEVTTCRDIT